MELFELLKRRRSCRKFMDRKVEDAVVDKILEGTLMAPSSKNCRSSRFMIVSNEVALGKMSQMRSTGSTFLKDAPMAVVVMGDNALTDLWVDNCAISATIMQLCAESLGLGSCWVHVNGRPHRDDNPQGESAEEYLRGVLPIPDGYRVLCVIAMGYPAEALPERKPKDDTDKIIKFI